MMQSIVITGLLLLCGAARADWLKPDESYRDALQALRTASRDTLGHGNDPARLDSLGAALLKLGRLSEAQAVYERVRLITPGDTQAAAALGKIALFTNRLGEAESLLAIAMASEPEASADMFATRIRRGDLAGAAELAAEVHQEGRAELLRLMMERGAYEISAGPQSAKLKWARSYPVPIIRVKLNGQSVLMALDTGAGDVLLDESAARRYRVQRLSGQHPEFWNGSRVVVGNALIERLEIAGIRIERLPAGTLSLRKWSLAIHPHAEPVVGVIGLNVLRRFTPVLDYKRAELELHRLDAPYAPPPSAPRIPFQVWGESELTVYGSLAGSRRMAFVVQTGVPGCAVGAPAEVFEEIGVKPGMLSRLAKGAGQWLQGQPWSAVQVPTVTVGPIAKDRVAGCSGALDSSELWRHGVRRDALISSDFFRDRRVTIDWRASELIVEE